MKKLPYYILLVISCYSCSSSKKVQSSVPVVAKEDTSSVLAIINNTSDDSVELIKDIYHKVIDNKINFETFSAKIKADISGDEVNEDFNLYARIKKDSLIWLSFRGALGIEGYRALISPDTVKVLDQLNKTIDIKPVSFLQRMTKLPFDFYTLQDILIGNPVYTDSNIVTYQLNADDEWVLEMDGNFFNHQIFIDKNDLRIKKSELRNKDLIREKNGTIVYGDYDKTLGVNFAKLRNLTVVDQSIMNVSLEYKQYDFNKDLSFPFSIPDHYTRL